MVAEATWSDIGLVFMLLPALVHCIQAPELLVPTSVLNIVHFSLFPMFARRFPKGIFRSGYAIADSGTSDDGNEAITSSLYYKLFADMIENAPASKQETVRNLIFMMRIEQRQGSTGFLAVAAAAVYALTQDLHYRSPVHLAAIVISFGLVVSHLIHLLVPDPLVTRGGKLLAISFGPLFAVSGAINILGFIASRNAMP